MIYFSKYNKIIKINKLTFRHFTIKGNSLHNNCINLVIFIGLLCICLPQNVCASDTEDLRSAQKAIDARNFTEALNYLRPLAKRGNRQAELELGTMYEIGQGVKPDMNEALKWYKRAAKVKQSPKLSVHLTYSKELNDPKKEFKTWLEQAKSGDSQAQNDLGYCYLKGLGVKVNYVEAKKWFEKSSAQGNTNAMVNLGFVYQNGAGIQQNYDMAAKLYRQAADGDNIVGKNNLGLMYVNGIGINKDYSEAAKLFKQASDAGNMDAMSNLGYLYQKGYGLPKDFHKAVRLYLKSASYGNPAARYNLGYMYQAGIGVTQNYAKAAKLYELAAGSGYPEAQCRLGFMYQNGMGVPKDYSKALKYYKKQADAKASLMVPDDSLETVSP